MSTPPTAILVLTTTGSATEARSLAKALLDEGLIACAHLFPKGESLYRWEGELKQEEEWTILLKSEQSVYERLQARIVALHSYQVPEILAVAVSAGYPPYLQWLALELVPPREGGTTD